MIPFMMITKFIVQATGNVHKNEIENNFNIKIKGQDVIKLLVRLRCNEKVEHAVYIDDEFIITRV